MAPGQVVLVCGPPCAGKSTWVEHHAQPGDLIVCFDHLARAAGSPRRHDHHREHLRAAGRAYERALADLEAGRRAAGTTWVIRCAPAADERAQLAERVRADEVHVLMPPEAIAHQRADRDRRARRTHGVIQRWYAAYQARPGEHVHDVTPTATSRAW